MSPRAVVGRRQFGGGAPPRALRETRSTGLAKRGRRRDGGPRCRAVHVPTKPLRRLIPASAPVGGNGHQFRRGVDQPELRVSSGVSHRLVVLLFHASVTRRAASYGFDPQRVSIQPGAGRRQRLVQRPCRRSPGDPAKGMVRGNRHPDEARVPPIICEPAADIEALLRSNRAGLPRSQFRRCRSTAANPSVVVSSEVAGDRDLERVACPRPRKAR